MNGFVRLLEAIIASVILLTSLTFFISPAQDTSDWESVILHDGGKDSMAVAIISNEIKTAVRNNNASLADKILVSKLPRSAGFSLSVKGIPNPVIKVGCHCNQAETTNLRNRLAPLDFVYKGRNISIRVENTSLTEIRADTDILFMFDYEDLKPRMNEVKTFLKSGGTIFMFGDVSINAVNDGVLNETFGLSWSGSSMAGSGTFYSVSNANITSFRVAKYYTNITANGSQTFSDFHTVSGPTPVNRVRTDYRTVIADSSGLSLVKTNSGVVEGSGRTVWLAGYNGNQNDALLKAVVMWASGEEFSLDPQPRTPGKKTVTVSVFAYDQDPYIISLTLWNLFN